MASSYTEQVLQAVRVATVKMMKERAAKVNTVIHNRNLYLGNDRFIDAQVEGDGEIYVRSIHTGKLEKYEEGKFTDRNGSRVQVEKARLM